MHACMRMYALTLLMLTICRNERKLTVCGPNVESSVWPNDLQNIVHINTNLLIWLEAHGH